MNEFYRSDEFIGRIKTLENAINKKFNLFLGTTNKEVKINLNELATFGSCYIILNGQ